MKTLLFAAALALVPTLALAQTYELTVKNGYPDAVTGLSVSGGKVEAFKPVPAAATRKFNVTLPDGKCTARVGASFANGERVEVAKFDFCQFDMLDLSF